MELFKFLLFLLPISILINACQFKESNPELRSPVYQDMKATSEALTKSIEEKEKELEGLRKDTKSLAANSRELRQTRTKISKALLKLKFDKQKLQFLTIQLNRRLYKDRLEYSAAFEKGEEWPKPDEFSSYQYAKKLRDANRKWDQRVPKLSKRAEGLRAPAEEKSSGGHGEEPSEH
ncbi:MAG: hypothetical protein KDD22_05865 [Bdellovibrionales bacterium]|nr:hypothetical protein [Bdellovibrionales bacterium]